ncbi:2-methylcitrate dehydratase [Pigmentiphaga humi]|uniref:2-methylcitrate dehydratase n=1 Tax=Pigmentiphaga humi TaxID=2478468 RepID=A0A3P4AZG9_9BURK|nr:MmgE/PrpD family protein [Pigmentiphaga humi]VCU69433.1 2-methylcitrate dehydratase [Pigmentiphaga humi]
MNTTPDRLLQALAAFSRNASLACDASVERAVEAALLDTLAVALGALTHPAAVAARRYARHAAVAQGATLWGTGERVTAEAAALVNGVPLRAYDYNDLYIGKSGGHPSDMVPGLVALAQWRGADGPALMGAIALGYEVAVALFDHLRLRNGGLDYPNIVAIACTCAAARLLDLSETQAAEALAITVIPHLASLEVESNDLNRRGDLTMWKRFNGSDAIRQSVYACLLAEAGAEGAVRPFEGRYGLLAQLELSEADHAALLGRLDPARPLEAVKRVTYKLWPVGSRGQSAIQAALQARSRIPDPARIASVRVLADEGVYDHLVSQRADPWHPVSRETADHSLPCIVAMALLDGRVDTGTFAQARVTHPDVRTVLNDKLVVEPSADLSGGSAAGFLARVEVTLDDGEVVVGEAGPPPGHILKPFSDGDFEEKLRVNVEPVMGAARTREILQAVRALHGADSVEPLCALLGAGAQGVEPAQPATE